MMQEFARMWAQLGGSEAGLTRVPEAEFSQLGGALGCGGSDAGLMAAMSGMRATAPEDVGMPFGAAAACGAANYEQEAWRSPSQFAMPRPPVFPQNAAWPSAGAGPANWRNPQASQNGGYPGMAAATGFAAQMPPSAGTP